MLESVLEKLKQQEVIFVAALAALAVLFTPIQHYVSLARFQHYGLCIFVLGLGYILQVIWSWRYLRTGARLGYLGSGLYLGSAGIILYANPFLDPGQSLQTEWQISIRNQIACFYLVATFVLACIWLNWLIEEIKNRGQQRKASDN